MPAGWASTGPDVLPFLDALKSGRVLLMDGAMGTELQRVGLREGENASKWNRLHPDRVRAIHRAHLDAGAEVHLTNTFLINAGVPGRPPDGLLAVPWQQAFELIGPAAPYRVAAVGPVAGDPSGREFHHLGWFRVPNHCTEYRRHECCHDPDAILLETCSSPRVRFALKRLLRKGKRRPLLVSFTYQRDDRGRLVTASGHSPEWFARRAKDYGADALGVNCGRDVGMDEIIEVVRRYRDATDLPLFARPNAGTPRREGDRWLYPESPETMAARLPQLLEAGVCMVGGCCGTTPAHIAAFRKVVDEWNARRAG
jgi:5-methyltetrahydrofolate--homocysteine methyltransferase